MINPALRVSVVVPTYRRADLLDRCLAALVAQTLPPQTYEIIVCDDGPSRDIQSIVQKYAERAGHPRVRYESVRDTQGPAGARNVGWRAAQAELVAFTDDDTVPTPGWLEAGLRALSSTVDAVTGPIRMPIPSPPSDYELDASHLQEAEFATANCMVRRRVLQDVGGFDTRYTMAWREDSDLHFALLAGGYSIVHEPAAIVVHPLRPGRYAAAINMQRKVMFDTLLYKKYPDLYRQKIRRGLPWFYLSITALAVVIIVALIAGRWEVAGMAATAWAACTGWFLAKRLKHTRRDPSHIVETLITSIVIPPASIFWRVVGSIKFKGGFP